MIIIANTAASSRIDAQILFGSIAESVCNAYVITSTAAAIATMPTIPANDAAPTRLSTANAPANTNIASHKESVAVAKLAGSHCASWFIEYASTPTATAINPIPTSPSTVIFPAVNAITAKAAANTNMAVVKAVIDPESSSIPHLERINIAADKATTAPIINPIPTRPVVVNVSEEALIIERPKENISND